MQSVGSPGLTLVSNSPILTPLGPDTDTPFCTGEVQNLLSGLLSFLMDKTSSLVHITPPLPGQVSHLWQVARGNGGHISLTLTTPWSMREGAGAALLLSH